MLSMQALGWLLLNLGLYTVMAFGIAAGAAHLFSLLRQSFCQCNNRDCLAALATAVIILFSLALLPQPSLMSMPLINALPMVIFVVYMVLGLVHMCLWSKPLLAMLASVVRTPRCCDCRCECRCTPPVTDPCGCGSPGSCGCRRPPRDCGS